MEESNFKQLEQALEKEAERLKNFNKFVQNFEKTNGVKTEIKLRRLYCMRLTEEREPDWIFVRRV